MIRVVVADDQAAVRAGFVALLERADDVSVVGEAADGDEAHQRARSARPDVVLMDIRMPDVDGIEATRRIVADPSCDGVRVLIVTTYGVDPYVYDALRSGASGFVTKTIEPEDLREAVRIVARGDGLLSPSVTSRVIEAFAQSAPPSVEDPRIELLTEREREVWRCVVAGASNDEIARSLVISPLTAKTHVSRILDKLEVRSRVQLVALAYETGFVARSGDGRSAPRG